MSPARAAAAYAAAGVLLWLFFRGAETHVLMDGLRSAGWRLVALAIAVRIASLAVSSLRWQLLLSPIDAVPFEDVISTMMMGMAVAAVAPMQVAEVVRPYLLAKRRALDFSAALATIVVEWVLDAMATLVFFVPALVLAVATGATAGTRMVLISIAATVIMIAMLARLPRWVTTLAAWSTGASATPGWRGRAAARCADFCAGLRIVHQPPKYFAAAGYSILLAAMTAASAWLALVAFGLAIPPSSGFLLLGLVLVGGLLPTPGAVGSFHAICQVGLMTFFHIDRPHTVLPVIALHAVLYLPGAVVGAFCFIPGTATTRARAY